MRRSRVLEGVLSAVALPLIALGCSTDGQVVIDNETATQFVGEIDGRGIALSGFESVEVTIKIGTDVLIFGPSEKEVDFSGESCTLFPFATTVTVNEGDATRVTLEPDASCVVLQNNGASVVDRFQYRSSGTTDWGGNQIDEELFAAESEFFRLPPGIYDFRVIDQCPDTTLQVDVDLSSGERFWLIHQGGLEGCE